MRRAAGAVLLAFLLAPAAAGARDQESILVRRDRVFSQSYQQVWEATITEVRRGGWEIVRSEKGKGIMQTGWFEFAEGTFGPSVAIKPPPLTWEYGFYHRVRLDAGRSRLRISLRTAAAGTRVSVHADVQEYNFHRDLREYMWGQRESNGAIEIRILDLLERRLDPQADRDRSPADDSP